jgi:PPM family protein phosphatase
MDLTDKIEIVCKTDTGKKREHNEDSVAAEVSLGLAVLADGIGGYQAGEVASAMAVDTVMAAVAAGIGAMEAADPTNFEANAAETNLIDAAILQANKAIYEAAKTNPKYQGMGTTIVVVLLHDNIISIGHVGDSRLYRLRDNKLELITEDHSLVRELVRKGYYTEEQAREAANKNVVTRALGVDPDLEVEVQEDLALLGDIYLLCSDCLNDMVPDVEIERVLTHYGADLHQTADQLIRLANEMGGKDNISAILLRLVSHFSIRTTWLGKIGKWFTVTQQ